MDENWNEFLDEWAEKMEALGYYLDFCQQPIDGADVCGGPVLSTEDGSECFACGHKGAPHNRIRLIDSMSHGVVAVNEIGEWL